MSTKKRKTKRRSKKNKWKKFWKTHKKTIIASLVLLLVILCISFPQIPAKIEEWTGINLEELGEELGLDFGNDSGYQDMPISVGTEFDINEVPEYSGEPYVVINNNNPYFTEDDLTTKSFEYYSNLDSLGRCGVCIANIGIDIMPTQERESIGSVTPSG